MASHLSCIIHAPWTNFPQNSCNTSLTLLLLRDHLDRCCSHAATPECHWEEPQCVKMSQLKGFKNVQEESEAPSKNRTWIAGGTKINLSFFQSSKVAKSAFPSTTSASRKSTTLVRNLRMKKKIQNWSVFLISARKWRQPWNHSTRSWLHFWGENLRGWRGRQQTSTSEAYTTQKL